MFVELTKIILIPRENIFQYTKLELKGRNFFGALIFGLTFCANFVVFDKGFSTFSGITHIEDGLQSKYVFDAYLRLC